MFFWTEIIVQKLLDRHRFRLFFSVTSGVNTLQVVGQAVSGLRHHSRHSAIGESALLCSLDRTRN